MKDSDTDSIIQVQFESLLPLGGTKTGRSGKFSKAVVGPPYTICMGFLVSEGTLLMNSTMLKFIYLIVGCNLNDVMSECIALYTLIESGDISHADLKQCSDFQAQLKEDFEILRSSRPRRVIRNYSEASRQVNASVYGRGVAETPNQSASIGRYSIKNSSNTTLLMARPSMNEANIHRNKSTEVLAKRKVDVDSNSSKVARHDDTYMIANSRMGHIKALTLLLTKNRELVTSAMKFDESNSGSNL